MNIRALLTALTIAVLALVGSDVRAQVAYVSPSTTDVTFVRSTDNSYTDTSKTGTVNLGSDTSGSTLRGARGNYASV
ncbi:MAG TPA: hypothetical protein VE261_00385, partial [Gaiellaceae bacterium]|nr:hypothetical protein [Gaiellaceae bacterium]